MISLEIGDLSFDVNRFPAGGFTPLTEVDPKDGFLAAACELGFRLLLVKLVFVLALLLILAFGETIV